MDTVMKIVFAFIGTSKYLDFFPKYYESIEEYFVPDAEKTFLVFTDGEIDDVPDNVKVYHQEHLEWPYITLKRFEIINKARKEIEKNDWFVFLDADTRVVSEITKEDFFDRCCQWSVDEVPLFGVQHPCEHLRMAPHTKCPGAFETNLESEAGISEEELKDNMPMYVQGCFWGGQRLPALTMIDELEARVNRDLEKGIVAKWHDESHINKYFEERWGDVHRFGPDYAFPEVFADICNADDYFKNNPAKIVHLAKDNSSYQI